MPLEIVFLNTMEMLLPAIVITVLGLPLVRVLARRLDEMRKRYGRTHFSERKEDWIILDFLQDCRGGTFVDCASVTINVPSNARVLVFDDGRLFVNVPGSSSGVPTIQSGTLTVCSDIPYAPFEFEENGKQVGIDIDLVTAIATELDLKVSIKDTDFDGIFAALAAGQCDMVASSVSITDERKANNEFTQGYYEIQQSLLVRKADADRYKSLTDLTGRTIGVQSGTTGEEYARSRLPPRASVRAFTGADELFTALKAGQIDGVLQDLPVNAYRTTQDDSLEVVQECRSK